MTNHETRFGALWTNEEHPFAKAKRFLHKVRTLSDEEFASQRDAIAAEWETLKPSLTSDQIYSLFNYNEGD